MMHLYASVASFSRGEAIQADWNNLCAMTNTATELDLIGYQGTYADIFLAATEAIKSCGLRKVKLDRFGFTMPELTAVRQALDIHQQQLEQVSRNQYNQAVDNLTNKFRKGNFETVMDVPNV